MKEAPATSPSKRSSVGMAYDAARAEVVLFGGGIGASTFDDTWTWDGTPGRDGTWTRPEAAYAGWATAASLRKKKVSRSLVSTMMWSPSLNLPARTSTASGFSTMRWMARFSGRAPKTGS